MQELLCLVLLLAVILLVVVLILMVVTRKSGDKGGASAPLESNLSPAGRALDRLKPGDAISLWGSDNVQVRSVIECSEQLNERTSNWRWVILSNNQLLWIAPDGKYIYDEPETIFQGTAEFEQITGDPGVLRTFEKRVREGVSGSQPVNFEYNEKNYTARSTGTFAATVTGEPLTHQVWADLSPDPSQNVFFEMETATGERALGIWTSHIAWYAGRILQDSDIEAIYQR